MGAMYLQWPVALVINEFVPGVQFVKINMNNCVFFVVYQWDMLEHLCLLSFFLFLLFLNCEKRP